MLTFVVDLANTIFFVIANTFLGHVQTQLIVRVKVVSQFVRPNTGRLHVYAEMRLVRCGGQRERVVLVRPESRARQSNPLAREVLEIRRSRELQFRYVGRQQFGLQNVQLYVLGLQAEDFVQSEYDCGYDEEYPKSGSLCGRCETGVRKNGNLQLRSYWSNDIIL